MAKNLDPHYWNSRYEKAEIGWDIGRISTPLQHYIDQLAQKDLRILIPGCGNAYEAAYLLEQGFTDITLVDVAEVLVKQLQNAFYPAHADTLRILHQDFFSLKGEWDLIIEQTFFCALDPQFRPLYAQKMHELLSPNGKLVGLLFNRNFPQGGPPFGGSAEEYAGYFENGFEVKIMEECYNSIAPRQGSELFICLTKQ